MTISSDIYIYLKYWLAVLHSLNCFVDWKKQTQLAAKAYGSCFLAHCTKISIKTVKIWKIFMHHFPQSLIKELIASHTFESISWFQINFFKDCLAGSWTTLHSFHRSRDLLVSYRNIRPRQYIITNFLDNIVAVMNYNNMTVSAL